MFVYVKIYCFIIVYLVSVFLCKFYLVLYIIILCIVIISNICNEQNSTIVNVTINILLILALYYNWFNFISLCSFYININSKLNWYHDNIPIVM